MSSSLKIPPMVGIVILNYNHAKLTIDCVHSIRQQNYTNYKIVVVDNNSPDLSQKEILKNELSKDVAYQAAGRSGCTSGSATSNSKHSPRK